MQTEQLQTLSALVDEGTFDAAARRLHVTASAVSQRVKAMEQEAGRVLVQRTTPVTLTEAGTVMLRFARQVALLEADARRELAGDSAGPDAADESRPVTRMPLAVNADSLATWFLPSLAGLGDELGVAFDLHRDDQERTTRLLRSGTVLAAVTSTREPVQGCVTSALGAMRYRAVCSPAFREQWLPGGTGGAQDPELVALRSAPAVHFDNADDLQDAFLRDTAGGPGSGPRHFIPTSGDFARAVVLGFGWGMLPEQQCLEPLAAGELVELAPDSPVDVPLYWQRWNLRSALLDSVTAAVARGAAASLLPL
ncbi:transcriptional regulator ArgP [Frondihabitans sp. PAMC 28766]|uniref:LysR family transcriptional regulator ArgP n=1 Tax=Frondihabitans sp. PAMC 28766 TaxID=1795630 RepID=UPI00078D3CFB|nr:LysR family transcriptional regulator ArgP [Frondihabitans sp. PAMC 28766]AMM19767.1 transcriptional regulator ArgP [Frondihabitans sp. PAMC 28766]